MPTGKAENGRETAVSTRSARRGWGGGKSGGKSGRILGTDRPSGVQMAAWSRRACCQGASADPFATGVNGNDNRECAITPPVGADLLSVNATPPASTAAITPDDLATVEEVAARTRHSCRTIRHWLRTHRLVGVRVGRRWLIPLRDLNAVLSASRTEVHA